MRQGVWGGKGGAWGQWVGFGEPVTGEAWLVGWWKFDEPNSAWAAVSSGHAHAGRLKNVSEAN